MSLSLQTFKLPLALMVLGLATTLPGRAAPIIFIGGNYGVVTHNNTNATFTLSVSNPAGDNADGYTLVGGRLSNFFMFDAVPSPITLTLDPAHPTSATLTPLGDFILTKNNVGVLFGLTEPGRLILDPANFRATVTFDVVLKSPGAVPSAGVPPPPDLDFRPLFGPGLQFVLGLNNESIRFTGGPTPSVTITDRPGQTPTGTFEISKLQAQVPEPASVLLWGLAAVVGGAVARSRRRRQTRRT